MSVTASQLFGANIYYVVFDAPFEVLDVPNWGLGGADPLLVAGVVAGNPTDGNFFFDTTPATSIVVPSGATGVFSRSGGAVVPGTYPVM